MHIYLDEARKLQIREQIATENGISIRTLYRYEKAWREDEFQGLKPCDREKHRRQDLPDNFEELLQQAIQLKREVPKRSVAQIIAILELEHRVAPGVLKRSTLERHLYQAGYGRKQLQMYCDARKSSSKRFCKLHRMMLIQTRDTQQDQFTDPSRGQQQTGPYPCLLVLILYFFRDLFL